MAVNSLLRLDKTAFSVSTLEQNDEDEKVYWLSKTPYERLDAVETMRQIIYGCLRSDCHKTSKSF